MPPPCLRPGLPDSVWEPTVVIEPTGYRLWFNAWMVDRAFGQARCSW